MERGQALKDTVKQWLLAIDAHASGHYTDALEAYRQAEGHSARILYNMSCAHVCLGDQKAAIECLDKAICIDENLAIGFFQRGCLHLQTHSLEDAIYDLEMSKMILRGNRFINYRPLGMLYKLNSCEILYNLALAYYEYDDAGEAEQVLMEASHDTEECDPYRKHINDAIEALKAGQPLTQEPYTVPTDRVFVPPKSITDNLAVKKLTKISKVVFTSFDDKYPGFHGPSRVEKLRFESAHAVRVQPKSIRLHKLKRVRSLNDLCLAHEQASHLERPIYRNLSLADLSKIVRKDRNIAKFRRRSSRKSLKKLGKLCRKAITTQSDPSLLKSRREIFSKSRLTACEDGTAARMCIAGENMDLDSDIETLDEGLNGPNGIAKKGHHSTNSTSGCIFRGFSGSCRRSFMAKPNKCKLTRMIKSTPDLTKTKVVLPLTPKPKSRSALSKLKKTFLDKDSSKKKNTSGLTTLMMHGFQNVNSLLTGIADVAVEEETNDVKDPKVDDKTTAHIHPLYSNVEVKKAENAEQTLTEAFGDRSTVLNYGLSEACDVATAVVTPTSDGKDPLADTAKQLRQVGKGVFIKRSKSDNNVVKVKSREKRPPVDTSTAFVNSLMATCQMFSAFVHADFGEGQPSEIKDNVTEAHIERNPETAPLSELPTSQQGCCESSCGISFMLNDIDEEIDISQEPPETPYVKSEKGSLGVQYVSPDGKVIQLLYAKSPPPSYPPPPLPPGTASNRKLSFQDSENPENENLTYTYLNGSSSSTKCKTAESLTFEEELLEANGFDYVEGRDDQKKMDDFDDDGYMDMSGVWPREPSSGVKLSKNEEKSVLVTRSLENLIDGTSNFAAAFAGLQISEETQSGNAGIKENLKEDNVVEIDENQNVIKYENLKSPIKVDDPDYVRTGDMGRRMSRKVIQCKECEKIFKEKVVETSE